MNAWQLSSIRLLFVVILCEVWLHYVTQANEDLCRHLKFGTPVQGFALAGHVVKNLSIGIYASCKHLCLLEDHCVSFNLGPPIKDRMVCELSDSDSTKHPEDFKPQEGFVHRGTENACSSNPCRHNATCLNGFTDERYLCVCQAGYTGRQCGKENWKKINTDLVCFGAEGDRHGTFAMGENGSIYTFKLIHRTGALTCNQVTVPHSYWGCATEDPDPWYGDKKLTSFITYPNNTALPIAEYARDDSGCGHAYHSYRIDGIDVNSSELVFNILSPPMSVSIGQIFHIWYSEDLHDCGEHDNSGETCTDVYAWYTTD
ncbi:hypothetical protein ACROYT_G023340 [Oculina patagonica]